MTVSSSEIELRPSTFFPGFHLNHQHPDFFNSSWSPFQPLRILSHPERLALLSKMTLPSASPSPPSSHPILLRPAVPSDAPSGHFTHLSSWQTSYVDLLTPAQIDYLPNIRSFASPENFLLRLNHPEQTTLVAIHPTTGDVVGFATATKSEDEHGYLTLQSVYLLEEWKGQGLGRRLTEGVLPERGDGKTRRALVVCLADNKPGRNFYEKMGFTRYADSDLGVRECCGGLRRGNVN